MTELRINSTEVGEVIFKSEYNHRVWYKLIELIGLPVDTDGNTVDSIRGLIDRQGENGIACFTSQSPNYRTNQTWYTIRTK